jgi:hypothetical protein
VKKVYFCQPCNWMENGFMTQCSQNMMWLQRSINKNCFMKSSDLSKYRKFVVIHILNFSTMYSARRLIGSRIIESVPYCNHKWLSLLYLNSSQNTSVDWIRYWIESDTSITCVLVQRDSIKRRALYLTILIRHRTVEWN